MNVTVTYKLTPAKRDPAGLLIAHLVDARNMERYLEQRGITISNIYRMDRYADFYIEYRSPAHRTAAELIMSGCPLSCTLTSTEHSTCLQ